MLEAACNISVEIHVDRMLHSIAGSTAVGHGPHIGYESAVKDWSHLPLLVNNVTTALLLVLTLLKSIQITCGGLRLSPLT